MLVIDDLKQMRVKAAFFGGTADVLRWRRTAHQLASASPITQL